MGKTISKFSIAIRAVLFISIVSLLMNCGEDERPIISPEPTEPTIKPLTLESIPGLSVQITSPPDESSVPLVINVEGTVSGLPSDHVLRVFVLPQSVGRWYAQKLVVLFPDSSWSSASVFVGDERSSGEDFLIGAMAVTEQQRIIIDEDLSGDTQFIISGSIPAIITVTRL